MTGTSSNAPHPETQLQLGQNLVHRDAANAATESMTLNTKLKIVHDSRSSKKKKQHVIGCEYCRIEVAGRQAMISCTAVIHRVLRD